MGGHSSVVAALTAIIALAGTSAHGQQPPASDTAWRYRASGDLEHLRECAAAELLVATRNALTAIDATTGARLWELTDLPSTGPGLFWPCDGGTGLSYRKDRLVAFDLVSGRRVWDAKALPPFQEIRGYATLARPDMLLLFLRTPASDRSLAALRLGTGERLWQRDDLFLHPPAFAGQAGVSDISEYQVFIHDTDTTLILYVSPDGPIRLDLRTGATLWKSDAFAGRRVPRVGPYAAMRHLDSVLVIPRDNGLVALDTRDGHVLWETGERFPGHATLLAAVEAGLLVRAGRAYVTVLDPATGAPRWQRPLTVPTDGAGWELVGTRYLVVSRDRLVAADLATGDTTGLTTLAFRDGEHAELMFATNEALFVASRQNLFRLDLAGAVAYQRFYKAPGAKFFDVLGGVPPGARFGAASFRTEYAYYVTTDPDVSGRTGNSLVRVQLRDGAEAGRIWFRERAPRYWPDTARDQVLILADLRTLIAVRFPVVAVPEVGLR